MVTYERYINKELHCWYDSSNLIYSKCYDSDGDTVNLKIVFKGGRTYLYRDVKKQDFMAMIASPSSGDGFNNHIKKYNCARLTDTDLKELSDFRESLVNADRDLDSTPSAQLMYRLEVCEDTGEFVLYCGANPIFRGVENEVSVVKFLRSMNIRFAIESVDEIKVESDEESDKIVNKPLKPLTENIEQ